MAVLDTKVFVMAMVKDVLNTFMVVPTVIVNDDH